MRTHRPGRHELGQNFLVDTATIDTVVGLVARTDGPLVEIGAGDGALTLPLQRLGRPLTAVEIDGRLAARLARRTAAPTRIVHADFLRHPLPPTAHVLVGNLPFHATTAMLRHVLAAPGWTDAVLLAQWEVARRRAGVGGATMMTAQWWPWYAFGLGGRVSAGAFRPRPGVDGGIITLGRRAEPLVGAADRGRYQDLVRRVFTGEGRGLGRIVAAAAPDVPRRHIEEWLREHRLGAGTLPGRLTAGQWADLYRLVAPARARTGGPGPVAPAGRRPHAPAGRRGHRPRP
ncbi:23S ribosomal RNA methyltransferase Erm [Streptomyces sp. NPDC014894]|uniref:23S ribosomal RNA methyltransferase Erm n=1 Tax=Streptomyces sp. NPDC014894 TaxID=3364931 RepID=UPI0036FCF74E